MGLFGRRKSQVEFDAELEYVGAHELLGRLHAGDVEEDTVAAVVRETGAADVDALLRPLGDLTSIPGRVVLDRRGAAPKGAFLPAGAPALPGVHPRTGALMLYPGVLLSECGGRDRPDGEQVRWRVRALERVPDDVLQDLAADGWMVDDGSA